MELYSAHIMAGVSTLRVLAPVYLRLKILSRSAWLQLIQEPVPLSTPHRSACSIRLVAFAQCQACTYMACWPCPDCAQV